MTWLYILSTLGVLLLVLLLMRVRLHFIYTPEIRTAGLTLGRRTGLFADLLCFRGTVRVMGITVYQMDLRKEKEEAPRATRVTPPEAEAPAQAKPKRPLRERVAVLRENLPQAWRALRTYLKGLYRATRVEELNGRIEAGFDSPDETGRALGYYYAALGIVPAIISRVQFVPVWMGPSFEASGRMTLAIPLYHLLWHTIVLLWQFPARKLIKGLR